MSRLYNKRLEGLRVFDGLINQLVHLPVSGNHGSAHMNILNCILTAAVSIRPGQTNIHAAKLVPVYPNRGTICPAAAQLPGVAIRTSTVVIYDPAVVLNNRIIKRGNLFERRPA